MDSITFICIYNKEHQLKQMLLNSFERLKLEFVNNSVSYEIKLIENRNGQYKSAAQAYNTCVKESVNDLGDIIVFTHQDIAFDNIDYWIRIIKDFAENKNQIIGAAGVDKEGKVLSNLKYFKDKTFITEHQIVEKTEVLSLDECCFAISKELFIKLYFDEATCENWHLYGVDLCYTAREKFETLISILPEVLYHKERQGGLAVDSQYLDSLWKVTKKHRHFVDKVYTSCYNIKTCPLLAAMDIFLYRLRIIVRRLLKR